MASLYDRFILPKLLGCEVRRLDRMGRRHAGLT
jgi:hypothetical protein